MWYCFLYSADIETLLLVSMKKTANENLLFFKDSFDPDSVYKCKQYSKMDRALENVTMRGNNE